MPSHSRRPSRVWVKPGILRWRDGDITIYMPERMQNDVRAAGCFVSKTPISWNNDIREICWADAALAPEMTPARNHILECLAAVLVRFTTTRRCWAISILSLPSSAWDSAFRLPPPIAPSNGCFHHHREHPVPAAARREPR